MARRPRAASWAAPYGMRAASWGFGRGFRSGVREEGRGLALLPGHGWLSYGRGTGRGWWRGCGWLAADGEDDWRRRLSLEREM